MRAFDIQLLANRFEQSGGKRITVTMATAVIVGRALRLYADLMSQPDDECSFRVDVWGKEGGITETMARASHGSVARAAFERACIERPGCEVTLRHGIRTIKVRKADGPGSMPSQG